MGYRPAIFFETSFCGRHGGIGEEAAAIAANGAVSTVSATPPTKSWTVIQTPPPSIEPPLPKIRDCRKSTGLTSSPARPCLAKK